jgi:hypothetical protein
MASFKKMWNCENSESVCEIVMVQNKKKRKKKRKKSLGLCDELG